MPRLLSSTWFALLAPQGTPAAIVERLNTRGFSLLDTQWTTAHLSQFGAIEIPRDEYLRRLTAAMGQRCVFP